MASSLHQHIEGALRQEIDDTTGEALLHAALIRYAPRVTPANPEFITQRDFDGKLSAISGGTYAAVVEGLHVYIEATARALWNHEHPEAGSYPNAVQEYEVAYNFNLLLDQLLDTSVEPAPIENGRIVPLLFGKPFRTEELSVGQHVLLCWAILLSRQRDLYRGKIVLLDEPEVYLHAEVCIRAIAWLSETLGPHGQIWIATHSLPLIAWAGTKSLYFVQNGTAVFAGSKPSSVWQSLLGAARGC